MNNPLPGTWRLYGRTAAFMLVVMYSVGAVGHVWPTLQPLMKILTPWFLLSMGFMVVIPSLATGGMRFALWVAGTYLFTFLAEVAGVKTGAIFGQYEYSPVLGPAVAGVPILIGFNWVLVVNGCVCVAGRMVHGVTGGWRRPALALVTGLLTVVFDFLLEPVAIHLDYWRWPGNVVPLQNYVAWFVIAALAAAFHPRQRHSALCAGCAGNLAWFYVAVQAVFFVIRQVAWRLSGT